MTEQTTNKPFWAILELMGHIRLAGLISEEVKFGQTLGRIDIPRFDESPNETTAGAFTTQYFNGASIYRLTPTTEQIARSIAKANQPTPAHSWELPQLNSALVEEVGEMSPEEESELRQEIVDEFDLDDDVDEGYF